MTEKERLKKLVKGKNTSQKIVRRALIILKYKEGKNKATIAKELSTRRPTVDLWIKRYNEEGITGLLKDASRTGRKPKIDQEIENKIVEATLYTKPRAATHWSTRTLAAEYGVSKMTIQRLWKKYNLRPHLINKFMLNNDHKFMEKVEDVVGLYINPPDKTLVFCVDEKSQTRALDRTRPSLPMKNGKAGTMTHDYKKHGTTSLFAALNTLEAKVIGKCFSKHTHKEFLSFLNLIDKQTPKDKDLHLILDNSETHKTESVKRWLKKNQRFNFHFIPASSSLLNMVERFFGVITDKRIRRGVFSSVKELEKAVRDFLQTHNEKSKIFKWTKDDGTIML